MLIITSLIITALIVAAAYFITKTAYEPAEIMGLVFIVLVVAFTFKYFVDKQSYFTEYFGSYTVEAEYYEDWDEKVSCRHPKYCTRTVSKTRTDSKGKTSSYTDTERYQCGTEHVYDVDYHAPYWQKTDNIGNVFYISQEEYNRLLNRFKTVQVFTDLNRHYHSNDGDKYSFNWNSKDKYTIDSITTTNSYLNKIRVSDSVYRFKDVSREEARKLNLFDYPSVQGLNQICILGYSDIKAGQQLDYINATYGARYQVRVFILVFKNVSMDASFQQQCYWQGGNKNELIICIGLDKDNKVNWARTFSWTKEEILKSSIDGEIMKQANKPLELPKLTEWLEVKVPKMWKRREFKEFDYLKVKTSFAAGIWFYFGIILLNVVYLGVVTKYKDG